MARSILGTGQPAPWKRETSSAENFRAHSNACDSIYQVALLLGTCLLTRWKRAGRHQKVVFGVEVMLWDQTCFPLLCFIYCIYYKIDLSAICERRAVSSCRNQIPMYRGGLFCIPRCTALVTHLFNSLSTIGIRFRYPILPCTMCTDWALGAFSLRAAPK